MHPRQARRERRAAERKAKKLELKKSRLSGHLPPDKLPVANALTAGDPRIQPGWNLELNAELLDEERSRYNTLRGLVSLESTKPLPPANPSTISDDFSARQPPPAVANLPQGSELGFVSQNKPAKPSHRATVNQSNAKLSTGPRSPTGKMASSRNSLKHGLASGTLIIPGEDPASFEALLNDLLQEHQPAASSEELLVKEMAQAYWLSQRAIHLQNTCFTAEGVNEKQLALFLRYQTTHERRFYKALSCLIQLRKEAARNDRGFVSQRAARVTDSVGFVSQTSAPSPIPPSSFCKEPDDYSCQAS